jgi:ABC-type multidrug transport system fused ATPase/permease subunit
MYPLLDVFWTMLWFFLWIMWIFLVVRIVMDIFRSRDLGGWGKAGWTFFVIVLPLLGVLVYLIARGKEMGERDTAEAQAQDRAFRSYVHEAAHENGSTADEIRKLADLHDHGAISDAEFERGKEKILSRPAA